jgi:galactoside O-acetyltransferase
MSDFAEVGENVQLYPLCTFINMNKIHLKSNIIISEYNWIHGGERCIIGNYIHIANFSSIAGGGVCIFEDFVGLSASVKIITGTELVNGEGLTNPTIPAEFRAIKRSYVHLKKHSFLGTNVIIHPGVTVGEGAVIGSNSVVLNDVEPWTINVGSPAKPIKKRNNEYIHQLEKKIYTKYNIKPLNIEDFNLVKEEKIIIPNI